MANQKEAKLPIEILAHLTAIEEWVRAGASVGEEIQRLRAIEKWAELELFSIAYNAEQAQKGMTEWEKKQDHDAAYRDDSGYEESI